MGKTKMGTLVYHLIHVCTPYQYIPKLLIENCHVSREEINRAGFSFGEFGIPWANHGILHFNNAKEIPADAVAAIKQGYCERLTKEEFLSLLTDEI